MSQLFDELERSLIAKGVKPSAFAINETPKDNQYCIQFDGEKSEVFYFERGLKMELATFSDMSAAIETFRMKILADQSVYVG